MLRRLLTLIMGPIIGLAYVIVFPTIVVAMSIGLVASKLLGKVVNVLSIATSFSWRPTEAYLAGRKGETKKEERKKG